MELMRNLAWLKKDSFRVMGRDRINHRLSRFSEYSPLTFRRLVLRNNSDRLSN
jgi:hypothetical protein